MATENVGDEALPQGADAKAKAKAGVESCDPTMLKSEVELVDHSRTIEDELLTASLDKYQ